MQPGPVPIFALCLSPPSTSPSFPLCPLVLMEIKAIDSG